MGPQGERLIEKSYEIYKRDHKILFITFIMKIAFSSKFSKYCDNILFKQAKKELDERRY